MVLFELVADALFEHLPSHDRPSVGAATGGTAVGILAALGVAVLLQLLSAG